jgi:putative NADPH-quinone reductase
MHKITVVDGHPDPARAHLVHALAERYAQAAREAGNQVRCITIADLQFPLLRVPADFYEGEAPESIRGAQADLTWADHLVFFYPLWMADMPAALRAFIEQAFRPGLALQYGAGPLGLPKRLFVGKSARIVVTMGMPPILYRVLFRAHTVRAFAAMLRFGGVGPVHVTLLGGMREGAHAVGERWIEKIAALATKDGTLHDRRRRRVVTALEGALLLAAGASVAARIVSSMKRNERAELPKFIIERNIAGSGELSSAELQAIAAKSNDVLRDMGSSIQWVESFVTDDKIYCIYNAEDKDLINEHARRGGFPADVVSRIRRRIDPTTADGTTAVR